ncbi:hypothetical protein FRB95_010854 [Tulasnella sp. JGI-2019a]|nr:hypothetical protein FRB95_010854 [Tulasnella sp. JGI-2019a]
MTPEREEKIDEVVQLLIEARETSPLGIDSAGELITKEQNEDLHACPKLHGVMVQRNRSWNHTRPLYRLPPEILIEIISIALSEDISFPHCYMERLQKFASVSHQWWLLAIGTPSFWKVASSHLPLELLQQVLLRSAGHLLNVVGYDNDSIPIKLFLSLVAEHAHRWRSLLLSGKEYDITANAWNKGLAHLSAPALEVLTLEGKSYRTLDIASWSVESLRHVKLSTACISWESKTLSGLQRLELENPGPRAPSGSQLLAILAASPDLVELKLGKFHQPQDSSHAPLQTMSVELPMLETLSVKDCSQEMTHCLLAAIHTPICTSFAIDYCQGTADNLGLFKDPELAHIVPVLVTSLRSSPIVMIEWSRENKPTRISTSAKNVQLKLGNSDSMLLVGLLDALENVGSSEIHLHFYRGSSPGTVIPPLRSSKCSITSICIYGTESHELPALVRFLTELAVVDGIAQWPFPRLKWVTIFNSNLGQSGFVEAIVKSIQMNGDRLERAGGAGVAEPCIPFRLTVDELPSGEGPSLTEEDVNVIRRVLGASNFTFFPRLRV